MATQQPPKTVALGALGFAVAFFATFYVLSRRLGDSAIAAVLGGAIFLGLGLLARRKRQGP
jgi:LPXTG-motif cell wall-anchored protein